MDRVVGEVERMRKAEYRAYLQSFDWQYRRSKVMAEHGGRCAMCENAAVHVHHLTYERVGCEAPGDLIPLCAECHDQEHHCRDCGALLTTEEWNTGRGQCFGCYCYCQDPS
jgi:hypothetical protein